MRIGIFTKCEVYSTDHYSPLTDHADSSFVARSDSAKTGQHCPVVVRRV